MAHVDDTELYEVAKRTLGIPPNENGAVPPGYLQELRMHVNLSKDDTNFRVFTHPGYGWGFVKCLEKECHGIVIPLTKNKNISEGIGSLSAFRTHTKLSMHIRSRKARIQATSSTRTSSTNYNRIATMPAIKQEVTEEDVKVTPQISLPLKITSGKEALSLTRTSTPRIKAEDPFDSKLFPIIKNEAATPADDPSPGRSSVPLKRASSPSNYDILNKESESKRVKQDFSSDHKSVSLNPRLPLSQFNGNVGAPLLQPPKNEPPAWEDILREISTDLGTKKQSSSIPKTSASAPFRVTYGDVKDFDDEELNYNGPLNHPDDLNKFLIQAGNAEVFDGNASVDKALERLGLAKLGESLPFMTVSLLPHQIIGVCWMLEHERGPHKGGILADEMGLGKTVQMIATMVQHRSDDPAIKTTLICAPVALLDQWKLEIEMKTGGHLSCLIYHGAKKPKSLRELQKYDVIMTTYGTLASEWPEDHKVQKKRKSSDGDFIVTDDEEATKVVRKRGLLLKMKWFRVVLDEAQNIRNKQTRASIVVGELNSIHRWSLTGTPVINNLTDCYGQFRFLKLRPWNEWSDFREHIVCHERRSPGLATIRLQAILNTCLLRRKKDTMLDGKRLIELPPKEIRLEQLVFSKEERDIYDVVEKKSQIIFNRYLRAGTVLKNYTHILVLLLRLRQLCGHPSLIQENADAFVRPEDDLVVKEEDQSEIHRATILAGQEFVEKIKQRRTEIMLRRIQAEKMSLDATVEEEDCPICYDVMNSPVITLCGHSFCKECLELAMTQPATTDNAERGYASTERPCPSCRSPIQKEMIFQRSAFEPTDIELGQGRGTQGNPEIVPSDSENSDDEVKMLLDPEVKCSVKMELSDDEEEVVTVKAGSRKKLRRRSYAESGSDFDDYSDSDSFICDDSDEDDEDDMRYEPKRRSSRKRNNVVFSDSEDDEILMPPKVVKRRTRKSKGERRKFLPSTKMIRMMELLKSWAETEETKNEKTMVVSQWTSCLDLVADYLDEHGFTYVRYQGNMSRAQRDQAVRTFMANGKARVLLMSLKGGGVGLNLTRANHVIALDLGWSPAVEQQAFDRVHRLGQTRNVTIDRLVIQDTVEARILALQDKKQNLMDGSLGEGKAVKLGRLSVRDLGNLFGLRA